MALTGTPRSRENGDAKLPKLERVEVKTLTLVEVKALLSAARGERLEMLYVLAVHTGLRIGELLGLRWGNVDCDAGTLRVVRQLQRIGGGGDLVFSPTKNSNCRTIKLTRTAVEVLRRHRAQQAEEKLMTGSLYGYQDLVFATGVGTLRDASNVMYRGFKPLLRRTGVPSIRFHDLRHTCGTLMLSPSVLNKAFKGEL